MIYTVAKIEKGKRKKIQLWNTYASIDESIKVNKIKELFNLKTQNDFNNLLFKLKEDYITLKTIEMESFGVSIR